MDTSNRKGAQAGCVGFMGWKVVLMGDGINDARKNDGRTGDAKKNDGSLCGEGRNQASLGSGIYLLGSTNGLFLCIVKSDVGRWWEGRGGRAQG